jgi:hypothetical protein
MFVSIFFRQPGKVDKEPLRPLYMYYKKLKNIITEKMRSGNTAAAASSNGRTVSYGSN